MTKATNLEEKSPASERQSSVSSRKDTAKKNAQMKVAPKVNLEIEIP